MKTKTPNPAKLQSAHTHWSGVEKNVTYAEVRRFLLYHAKQDIGDCFDYGPWPLKIKRNEPGALDVWASFVAGTLERPVNWLYELFCALADQNKLAQGEYRIDHGDEDSVDAILNSPASLELTALAEKAVEAQEKHAQVPAKEWASMLAEKLSKLDD